MRVEKEDWTGLAGEFTLSMFLASCFTVLFWSFYLLLVLPCFFVLDALELLVLLVSLFRLARISLVFLFNSLINLLMFGQGSASLECCSMALVARDLDSEP